MTISRVKSSGWTVNEKLTSSDMTDVDINTSYALDKRAGQTDTLASTVAVTGAINVSNGAALSTASGATSTFSGPVNLGATNTFGALSSIIIGGSVTFGNSSVTTFNSSSTLNLGGVTKITASSLTWNTASDVTFGHVDKTTNGATGVATTIKGQNETGTTSVGGDLVMTSGTGTSQGGNFYLQVGGTTYLHSSAASGFVQVLKPTVFLGAPFYSSAQSVAYSATVDIDFNNGNVFVIGTLTGNVAIRVANVRDGAIYTIVTTQDASGGHTHNWISLSSFGWQYGGAVSNLNTAANKINVFQFLGRVIAGTQYLHCIAINAI